jgi:uncharacterized protein (DUF2267 family)
MKYDQYAQEAHKFLKEVASELRTILIKRTGLCLPFFMPYAELLTPEESLHLIAQLPMLLKAIYINGWRLHKKDRIRSMDDF